jgi:hypothetical protein
VESTNQRQRLSLQLSQAKIGLLSLVTRSTQQISEETIDIRSLNEINRKQNIRDSLTHITDIAYDFFVNICSKILPKLKQTNLFSQREKLYDHVVQLIQTDVALVNEWQRLFSGGVEFPIPVSQNQREDIILEMYHDMCSRLVKVFVNQFRKDFLDQHSQKKKALRTELKNMKLGSTRDDKESRTKETKRTDKEPLSHMSLKMVVVKGGTLNFLVKDLKMLCHCYQVDYTCKDKKSDLQAKLSSAIREANVMPDPDKLTSSTPGTSSETQTSRKRKRSVTQDVYICPVCQKEDHDGTQWIECGTCMMWLHRECADIVDEDEWEEYSDGKQFVCKLC